ncbi:hypothetical protein PSPHG_CDS_0187 [Pseudomonas phage Psxphi15]
MCWFTIMRLGLLSSLIFNSFSFVFLESDDPIFTGLATLNVVYVVEVNETNWQMRVLLSHTSEHLQTAKALQSTLANVTRDNHLASFTLTGNDVLGLFLIDVFAFVYNEETLLSTETFQNFKRYILNVAILNGCFKSTRSQSILQDVDYWHQPHLHLLYCTSFEHTQRLAVGDVRTHEHNLVNLTFQVSITSHDSRDIGFRCASVACGDGERVFVDRLDVGRLFVVAWLERRCVGLCTAFSTCFLKLRLNLTPSLFFFFPAFTNNFCLISFSHCYLHKEGAEAPERLLCCGFFLIRNKTCQDRDASIVNQITHLVRGDNHIHEVFTLHDLVNTFDCGEVSTLKERCTNEFNVSTQVNCIQHFLSNLFGDLNTLGSQNREQCVAQIVTCKLSEELALCFG